MRTFVPVLDYKIPILEHLQEFMFADDVAESFNKEIAEQLQISAETVKVQKRRAINNLRQKLTPATMALLYMKLVVSTGSLKS